MTQELVTTAEMMGTGFSEHPDPALAAGECVRAALGGRIPSEEDLVFVFPTIDYEPHAFLEAAELHAYPARVVGCTSFACFTRDKQVGRGCVATYLPANGGSFGVAAVNPLGDDVFGAAKRVAKVALERGGEVHPHSVLLVLSDGLAGDQREIVRGTYAVTGAKVPLIGGGAGENLTLRSTYQFAEGRVMTNGVVAVWINTPQRLGVGVRHGWRPLGRPQIVTRASRNIVYELDGRPAVEAYFEVRGAELLNHESIGGQVMNHPFGVVSDSGRYEIRHIMNRVEDGLVLFGYVGEGAVVRVMASDCDDLLGAAALAAGDALAQLDTSPRGALVFSCTARVPLLGDRLPREIEAVSDGLGGCPAGGFFTFGEFARVTGTTGFHNATIAVLAF